MEIKTKFSIGSKVYTVSNCKAVQVTVERISVDKDGISYDVVTGKDTKIYSLEEKYLFVSKEQLLTYVASE